MMRAATAVALCLTVIGCHRKETAHAGHHAMANTGKTRVTEANRPLVDAIGSLPPAKQVQLQRAIACQVQRRHRAGATTPLVVTADLVKTLSARMERNPAIAKCARPEGT